MERTAGIAEFLVAAGNLVAVGLLVFMAGL